MKNLFKHLALSLMLLFAAGQIAVAQCTPDPNVPSVPGLYPNPLPHATGCQPNDFFVTFYFPRDTVVAPFGTLNFHYFIINGINGLPPGMSWQCNLQATNCKYNVDPVVGPLDTLGCVRFFGTPSLPGSYNITVDLTANVDVAGDQNTSFQAQLIVDPCPLIGTCFTLTPSSSCAPSVVSITNNIARSHE